MELKKEELLCFFSTEAPSSDHVAFQLLIMESVNPIERLTVPNKSSPGAAEITGETVRCKLDKTSPFTLKRSSVAALTYFPFNIVFFSVSAVL